jgi:hypothetical protein
MALIPTYFSNFKMVVAHYESINPLVSKLHTLEDDIRPIGDRNRKHERIVKISRNCYALSDGHHEGDNKFLPYGVQSYDHKTKTSTTHWDRLGKMEYYAPVVWRKHKDGTETVKIRNFTGSNSGYEISRYSFLERHMPNGMQFIMGHSALQYVGTVGEKHYLAKCKTVPRGYYKAHSNQSYYKWMQTTDDNSALVFTSSKIIGKWVHDPTTGKSLPLKPKVNKELKKKYKDDIDKFFEWGMTMSPMLPLSHNYNSTKAEELREHFGGRHDTFTPTCAREILRSPNHPMRLNYWVMFTSQIGDSSYDYESRKWEYTYMVKHVETKEQLQKVKNKFNTFINMNAGFIAKPKQ